ncbi:MAG: hypothetical protein RMJ31_05070 [Nitrososphaerota archaeon]|nr:hypothetical protein [Nitrososphaerota archaeon]
MGKCYYSLNRSANSTLLIPSITIALGLILILIIPITITLGLQPVYATQKPGNSPKNALQITSGRYLFDFDVDDQWFKVDLQPGQKISIVLTVPGKASLDLYLYSPDTVDGYTGLLASSENWEYMDMGGVEKIVYVAERAGFHYIRVRGLVYYARPATYELRVFISDFKIVSVYWGEGNSRLSVAPGDSGVPLTVVVTHQANYTITSLVASLNLKPPFSNILGGDRSTSFHSATVKPGEAITFTFTLNVDHEAGLGSYSLMMTIEYYMVSKEGPIRAIPVEMYVNVPLLGRPSITISTDSSYLAPGVLNELSLVFKNVGSGRATHLEATLTIPSGVTIVGDDNRISIKSIAPGDTISKRLKVHVSSNLALSNIQMSILISYRDGYGSLQSSSRVIGFNIIPSEYLTVEVNAQPSTLSPGIINKVNISIRNLGPSTITNLEVTFSPPTGIVIVGGSNSFYFQKLEGYSVIYTPLLIYVSPSVEGSVVQLQSSISYRKPDGFTHSLTRVIGFKTTKDTSSFLKVSQNIHSIVPNSINELEITVTNTRGRPIRNLSLSVVTPSPAVIISGDKQTYPNILLPNANTSFTISIFVPQGFQGSSLQLQLTISYLDEREVVNTESRVIGLSVKRLINPILISINDNTLTAGIVNNREIKITNIGMAPIYSVVVTLSTSPGAAINLATGQNRWFIESIPPKGSVTILPRIFATPDSVDKIYALQIDVSYEDSLGISYTETQSINLAVQGLIYLTIQDLEVSPSRVAPGGNFTIVGNILNRGNAPAMYTVVSARSPSLPISSAPQYVGQVDTNVITPFSISAQVDRRARNGTYPITVIITYSDNYNQTRSISTSTSITVGAFREQIRVIQPTQQRLILGMTEIGLAFFTAIFLIILSTVIVLWRSRKSVKRAVQESTGKVLISPIKILECRDLCDLK